MKYLICFRSADHPHDALKEGINPRVSGPIRYEGAIETDSALPMTPKLDVAPYFPNDGQDGDTTIDVILMPLPEKNDEIFKHKIELLKNKKSSKESINSKELFEVKESKENFVNFSSSQKLDSIGLFRAKASKLQGGSTRDAIVEEVYEELGAMIWAHEVAAGVVPRENVVASMKCERKDGNFKIVEINHQDEKIVNKDFIKLGYKEKLKNYLKYYYQQSRPILSEEGVAYRGYFTEDKDYREIHKDINYQLCLEAISRFCEKEKIDFTHEDNLRLMGKYKNADFDIENFCQKLKESKLQIQDDLISESKEHAKKSMR